MGFIVGFILFLIIIILVVVNVRIVPQSNAYVIERLGGYLTTWKVGLNLKIPLIDRISSKVSLKEKVVDFPPQPVITKDNVTMNIDTVVYFQITDPKLFTYGVDNPISAIENLTATSLRNIIGTLELDESLSSRDTINTQMRATLDEATDPWGIKVNRVEVKNIEPPRDIQDAMEKQMRAERERRSSILKAEGNKRSAVLEAEGKKEAAIREAEGQKESEIRRAEGTAEAIKKLATAEAKATVLKSEAEATAIDNINKAKPSHEVLTLRRFESMEKVSDGKATKLIIPSDLADMTSLLSAGSEILKGVKSPLEEDFETVSDEPQVVEHDTEDYDDSELDSKIDEINKSLRKRNNRE